MIQIVNFSGGKDSTAMLHLMLERGEQIDDVVFFDGGWDWPQMYAHIDEVERKTGIKISRIKPPKPFDYWFYEHEFDSKKRGHLTGYGWPGASARWCTRQKINAVSNYLKGKYLFADVIQCVGFAVGEERRVERSKEKNHRYPLIEYNYDERECKEYCYSLGYTFGGLYEYFNRVSCFCCPLQNKQELLMKKRHFPEVWEQMLEMERKHAAIRAARGQLAPLLYKETESLLQIDAKLRGKD